MLQMCTVTSEQISTNLYDFHEPPHCMDRGKNLSTS